MLSRWCLLLRGNVGLPLQLHLARTGRGLRRSSRRLRLANGIGSRRDGNLGWLYGRLQNSRGRWRLRSSGGGLEDRGNTSCGSARRRWSHRRWCTSREVIRRGNVRGWRLRWYNRRRRRWPFESRRRCCGRRNRPCCRRTGPGHRLEFPRCQRRRRRRSRSSTGVLRIVLCGKPQILALLNHLDGLLQPVVVGLVVPDLPDNIGFIALVQTLLYGRKLV